MDIRKRKQDHVELTLGGRSDFVKSAGFERYDFRHRALPELNYSEVDPSTEFLGRRFDLPLFVSSMTGGYDGATSVNAILSEFCQARNLPMGVGSQRAMIENPKLESTFSIVRKHAPTAFIAANIGGVQLANGWNLAKTRRLIDSIRADAVIVHLNPAQELVQPEGDRDFRGVFDGIKAMVENAGVPVIVKETGAGISGDVAVKLMDAGVAAIDVAGAGGTSWSRVEAWRREDGDHSLDDWGIPTVECLKEVAPLRSSEFQIIASGGVRSADDVLKCLCLGADMAAMAQPLISIVKSTGLTGLNALADELSRQLTSRMLLIGCASIRDCHPTHLRILPT